MILLNKIKKSLQENKFVFVVLLILIIANLVINVKPNQKEAVSDPLQADTIIPAGHVLLPIALNNIDSIKGLISDFGIIDLYVSSTPQAPGKKLASRIKILKAPYNPNEFAVLVTENLADIILRSSGQFIGVIQNRFVSTKNNLPQKEKKLSINIDYNSENNL